MLLLSLACDSTVQSIKQAQVNYKKVYVRKSVPTRLQVGDWVLVKFPQEEVGKMRKLSCPWYIRALSYPVKGRTRCHRDQSLISSGQTHSCEPVESHPLSE